MWYQGPGPRCDSLFRRYPVTNAMSKRLELQEQHRRARVDLERLRYSSNCNGPEQSLKDLANLLDGFGLQEVASAIRSMDASFIEQRLFETQEAKAYSCGLQFNQCIIDACAPQDAQIRHRKRRGQAIMKARFGPGRGKSAAELAVSNWRRNGAATWKSSAPRPLMSPAAEGHTRTPLGLLTNFQAPTETNGSESGRSDGTSGSNFDCESEYDSSSEADSEAAAIQDER